MKANRFNFRAWNKKWKQMQEGGEHFVIQGGRFVALIWHEEGEPVVAEALVEYDYSSEYVIMQSTGLTDKNGREIFEGDVVSAVALSNDHGQRGVTNTRTVRAFMGNSCLCLGFEEMGVPIFPFNVDHTIQILGNIHENPELVSA